MFFNKVSLQRGQTNFKNASINLIPYHSQIKKKVLLPSVQILTRE